MAISMAIIRLQGEEELRKGIHYEMDMSMEPIGMGGMGKVFKGFLVDDGTGLSQPVAIKFMYDDLPPNAYERARREASIQLRNDNLIEMLGFLETKERDGIGIVKKHYHVVSELLEGVSLSDLLAGKTSDGNGQVVPFAEKLLHEYRNDSEHFARTVAINVLSGLMALHDAGYIHRDIDPSNIMVTKKGQIKIIDFGIAKQMNTLTTGDRSLTVAGKFMGKPEYAAPELVLGDIDHQNQTTDIYAVGIMLYQCITGHTPFEGPRHEILQKQLKEKIPLSAIKNKQLRNIIATACDKRQEARYQTSAQMRVALEEVGSKGQKALPRKKAVVFCAVAVAILAVVIALVVKKNNDDRQALADEQARVALFEKRKAGYEAAVQRELDGIDSQLERIKTDSIMENDAKAAFLMDIYSEYARVEKEIGQDTLYHLSVPILSERKREVKQMLSGILEGIHSQANELRSLKEEDLASSFDQKADSIAAAMAKMN